MKAPNVETRVKWEQYFRFILLQRKDKNKELIGSGRELKKQAEKEKLSEVWKVDILPNWESHWDYEKRQPKNLDQLHDPKVKKAKGGKKGSSNSRQQGSIWNIFRRKKPSKARKYERSSLKRNDQDQEEIEEEDDEEEESEIDLMLKNKDLLLIGLWKKGIPHWLRSTLWPIAIGNQLEVIIFEERLRIKFHLGN